MTKNNTAQTNSNIDNLTCDRLNSNQYRESQECNCYPERPSYDHCPERPQYGHCYEKPQYDHCPEKPQYNHCHEKPQYDHCPEKPQSNHCHEKPQHDYCPERPQYDPCKGNKKPNCCCCSEAKFNQNECGKPCNPVKFECPDINCAICTPILADRIFDFKCVNQQIPRSIAPQVFTVDPRPMGCPPYTAGAPVCIEKVTVVYDCLGFSNPELPITLCNTSGSLTGTPQLCPSGEASVFHNYEGTISTGCICRDKGSTATLVQGPLDASIYNFQYIVEGFIGCDPFTARFPVTPSDAPNFLTNINLFSTICLPNTDDPLTLRAQFDLKFVVKSIVPTTPFSGGTFSARIFDELLISEKLYLTKSDALVVYSAPAEFKHHEK